MHAVNRRSLAPALIPLLISLGSSQAGISPTTLHFFPRTSCNTGTSLSYTTVADLYSDATCHTTPVGTEALYVDGIAEGCAIMAHSDSTCSDSALLSQVPITLGTCQFYGEGNPIGAWQGVCGDETGAANVSMSTSVISDLSTSSRFSFSTMAATTNTNMITMSATGSSSRGNATIKTGGGLASPTATPELQGPGVSSGGVANIHEDDWTRRMMFKALLAMGSAEVMWTFVPV